jgi:hypothetical protein
VQCPRCGKTDGVSYIEVRRVSTRRYNVRLQTGDDQYSMLLLGPEAGSETLDSITNEDRLECSCGNRWDVPDVDELDFEENETFALADKLGQREKALQSVAEELCEAEALLNEIEEQPLHAVAATCRSALLIVREAQRLCDEDEKQ